MKQNEVEGLKSSRFFVFANNLHYLVNCLSSNHAHKEQLAHLFQIYWSRNFPYQADSENPSE